MTAEPHGIAMIAADVEMKERKAKERKKMQDRVLCCLQVLAVFNSGIVNTLNFLKSVGFKLGKK